MASSQDTEITLGTGKLLFLFFGLVGICALFFAFGYTLGRKSEPGMSASSPAAAATTSAGTNKPNSGPQATAPMTFYKSVEQKEANPQLTSAADSKADTASATTGANPTNATQGQTLAANAADPGTTLPSSVAYFVQVAAVSKQEDADALVEALKKKEYPAFVAAQSAADKLFHVQVGPFSDVKDAEAMRTRLIGDGYSPILKR